MNLAAPPAKTPGKGLPRAVGWAPIAFGLLFFMYAFVYQYNYLLLGTAATGEVKELVREGSTVYATIEFPTGTDEPTHFRQAVSMRERFTAGTQVEVRYFPSNPASAKVQSFYQLWFPALVKTLIGVALCACGLSMLLGSFFGLMRKSA